ncbi:MAG: carboxypeptidase-like regulatory domain-containing protein [Candidatus Velthaea sp.]
MKRLRFAAVALAAVVTACGNPALPPAQNYATVVGRVFDASTNAPVAGAVVTASVVLNATSAADGTYKIMNVPIGQNEVQVQPPRGYAAQQSLYPIAPQAGETVTLNIPLNRTQ